MQPVHCPVESRSQGGKQAAGFHRGKIPARCVALAASLPWSYSSVISTQCRLPVPLGKRKVPKSLSLHPVRSCAQAALACKNDRAPLLEGFFLIAGQRERFRRCMVPPTERWQLQPRERRIRHTWPGWNVLLVCRWINSVTRQAVHRPAP